MQRLRDGLDGLGAASFLVTRPVNLRYLTGFESSNAALLVGRDRLVLATDGRYVEAARALAGVEVVQSQRDLLGWVGGRLGELAASPVAFEADHVTVAGHESLSGGVVELLPTTGVIAGLRAVKDETELAAIRRAARITDAAYERLAREQLIGRTEADVAWWLEQVLREEGAEALAFPVIVAAAGNGALPHAQPGLDEIPPDTLVVVDMGALLDGYCSDCTRTFATGTLEDEAAAVYELVLSTQVAALGEVRPGAECKEVDAFARERIADAGHGERFGHGLGHGVGLEVHELPTLSRAGDGELAPGNVVTVEPGVYLPERFGVRIEDLVVVREDGHDVLTGFPKELTSVS